MTSSMWTTNATSGMICRYIICNFGAQKIEAIWARGKHFAGPRCRVRPWGAKCWSNKPAFGLYDSHKLYAKHLLLWKRIANKYNWLSGSVTFAHQIQTFDLCRSSKVGFEVLNLSQNNCMCFLGRSPSAGTEKDDRIRELEIMVRSLEEKLTR